MAILGPATLGDNEPVPARLACTLTPREYEIATLVGAALSNKEIARRLGLTEGTVKAHLHSIYHKADVRNRTALTLRYHSNLLLNGGAVAEMVEN
jgi:DNA-binding NarL/FixJ family response regulator